MKRVLFSLLGVLGFSYIGIFVIFACFQRRVIYFPSRAIASEERMARIALPLGLEPWRDPQGVRIGWRQTHNTVADSEVLPWWQELSDFLLKNSEPR